MVVAIIFAVIAVIALALGFIVGSKPDVRQERDPYTRDVVEVKTKGSRRWYFLGAAIAALFALVFGLFSMSYQVETGESTVLKSWTGTINPEPVTEPGLHWKSPFENTTPWDIKSKSIMFSGNGETTHEGQNVVGAEITIVDKDGISANVDIQVVFSIKASEVVRLTSTYKDQANFESTIVENDVKSIPRDVASTFTTVQMFEERAQYRTDVIAALEKAWKDEGIIVDKVNVHGIRYPEDVQQRFKDAQNAQTDLLKAQTEAEIKTTQAQADADAAVLKAQGEAEANNKLNASLTDKILQQRWIDAVAKSGTIIVPEDFTSLGQLPQPAQ